MGLLADLPLALAPGMGLNAYFTFSVVKGMGVPWQVALGAVFLSGVLFLIISVLRIREWLINAIPMSLKLGIGAGIGLFLGLDRAARNGRGRRQSGHAGDAWRSYQDTDTCWRALAS